MPDLGKYAVEVALAYGVSLTLIVLLVGFVVLRNRRTYRALKALEAQMKDDG